MNQVRLWFFIQLFVFAAAHVFVNAYLLRAAAVPDALVFLREPILEGKIFYSHNSSGLFLHLIWTVGLAVHAVFAFSPFYKRGKSVAGKSPGTPSAPASVTPAAAPQIPGDRMQTAPAPTPPANPARAWWMVAAGGAMEIVWASGFKYPEVPSILVIAALLLSFDLLIRAARVLPVGTVYAVFTGIGTLGTTAVEAIVSGNFGIGKLLLILLLLACIIGLKLTGEERTG
ncbi:MAG TPA: SMR family transporter [Paenibacillaceae bacterium]